MSKQPSSVHQFGDTWWFNTSGDPDGPHATRDHALEAERIHRITVLGQRPRPVLIGMNNPYGNDPRYALWPTPERATGWRIWQMLAGEIPGTTQIQYRDRFDRYNVLEATGKFDLRAARLQAPRLTDFWLGDYVLVLGAKTRDAMWLPKVEPLTWHAKWWGSNVSVTGPGTPIEPRSTNWAWVPHPSGLCRWYNVGDNRAGVATALSCLYLGVRP